MAAWDPVVDAWYDLPSWGQDWGRAVGYALLAYVIYRVLRALATRALDGSPHVEDTLETFLLALFKTGGWIFILLAFLAGLGVDATALLGGVAVAGFIVGFALQDTLNNLAAGVVILLNKPFQVGEAVNVQGYEGVVTGLGIAMMRMDTWDGKYVAIPNGSIIGGGILNYSRNPTRRLDVHVSVSYRDNLDDAVRAVMRAVEGDERVLADPAPLVRVTSLAESGVTLEARSWIDTTRSPLLDTWSDLTRRVKAAVEDAGCTIPFPQRDVNFKGGAAAVTPARAGP